MRNITDETIIGVDQGLVQKHGRAVVMNALTRPTNAFGTYIDKDGGEHTMPCAHHMDYAARGWLLKVLEDPRADSAGVYFLLSEDSRYVKIGCSADIRSRVSAIKSSNPEGLRFLGAIIGSKFSHEKEWLSRFSHLNTRRPGRRGEWFRADVALLEAIDGAVTLRELPA